MASAWRATGPSGNAWGTTRFVPRDSIDVIMAHPVARSESGDLRAGTSPMRPSARLPICPSRSYRGARCLSAHARRHRL